MGFGVLTIASAAGVVISRNAVYSAFSLILSFFGLSTIYLLWGATFIAVIQILIYTGAIVVLFVFVVMLLNLGKNTGPSTSLNWFSFILASAATWLFCFLLLRVLSIGAVPLPADVEQNSIRTISKLLFTRYLWPFEVLSVFLLALIVSIFALARPESTEAH